MNEKEKEILSQEKTINSLRQILINYGNKEYGDCIIDEICALFGHATTYDVEEEKAFLPKEK